MSTHKKLTVQKEAAFFSFLIYVGLYKCSLLYKYFSSSINIIRTEEPVKFAQELYDKSDKEETREYLNPVYFWEWKKNSTKMRNLQFSS